VEDSTFSCCFLGSRVAMRAARHICSFVPFTYLRWWRWLCWWLLGWCGRWGERLSECFRSQC